ncbi:MAG: hypothetical protein ACOCUS_01815, partial [Polyangiales bacterium]
MREIARQWHEWAQALYARGKVLYQLIDTIGNHLRDQLHDRRVPDLEVQQEVNQFPVDLSAIDDDLATAFRVGARHALLVAKPTEGSA